MHHIEEFDSAEQKNKYVRRMFNNISRRYDFLNHFLSVGIDRYWRKRAIKLSRLGGGNSFLDIACGTGDLSVEAAKFGPSKIVAVDFAENMLRGFSAKKTRLNLDGKVEIVQANAEILPFPDHTFDVTAVAFGVRNFGDLKRGIAEMQRVLKVGGRIVVLEFSRPKHFPVRQLYFFYFKEILPQLGKLISKDPSAYMYLPNSVSAFPDGEAFEAVMRSANFKEIKSVPLTFGIATAYLGVK
ncbi:MAG: bifunctional demethylmenaquinone methyltransferase/2-methoxy-6-polyprenyl-1,4-benzoquinol methylase UbiE [Bacteroidetes bacterium]|nr:bifunctional demethylmenaquinone methyltransferase/2-methoxy-6-polyprenyl-1,4-benzoquinol methylase UbiE [Bacteroidota bacterium]MCL5737084.1 bifunctional demethylmenaquinone methyltransferase/2-methoxy-6-polyprenyl-1,4-benzoquinol methylase UbiE [Bacteroidota bacterium]